MKLFFAILIVAVTATPAFAQGTVAVDGYIRQNGTYVSPHIRTAPNGTCVDNLRGCR